MIGADLKVEFVWVTKIWMDETRNSSRMNACMNETMVVSNNNDKWTMTRYAAALAASSMARTQFLMINNPFSVMMLSG